jgi:hypothetical protein
MSERIVTGQSWSYNSILTRRKHARNEERAVIYLDQF